MPTKEQVLEALGHVQDPEIHRDIVSLNMVKDVRCEGGKVSFTYVLTTPACPLKGQMEREAREAILKIPGVKEVRIQMSANVQKDIRLESALPPGVKNIIAVGSGKGGVGKSTVAANLAVSLALEGAQVGLLDADVYGPNQPQMFGIPQFDLQPDGEGKIAPPVAHHVKVMSMGFLLKGDTPVIWRGPMLHGAINQFLKDVRWGDTDYLIVDLPPGTGDVQISLCQSVPLLGAVVVTTPQSIATSDVKKAMVMFKRLNVPLLGIIENMTEFICPHCKKTSEIFSHGGAQSLSENYQTPVIGKIPLDPEVCQMGEIGKPIALGRPDSPTAVAFREIAKQLAARISLENVKSKTVTKIEVETGGTRK
ncbi:MAG: Mrp/NBP35 family ATP-binding protein [Elusimicrobia bacterium]|nr:Mrp/NBP35 family ATP-binding protein [Elusimicrobiota bacterium]